MDSHLLSVVRKSYHPYQTSRWAFPDRRTPVYCGKNSKLKRRLHHMAGMNHLQLPTHPTGARRRRDIAGHGDSLEITVALCNGLPKGHPFRARSDRIGGIFDVGTLDIGAHFCESHCANLEIAVGAICRFFCGRGVTLQVLELLCCQAKGLASRFDMLIVDAREHWRRLRRHI